MKPPPPRLILAFLGAGLARPGAQLAFPPATAAAGAVAALHTPASPRANVVPVYGTGPPPAPPEPSAAHYASRIARRRKQAALLRHAQELRAGAAAAKGGAVRPGSALKRRFWREVHVKEVDGALEIHLDTRPIRRPSSTLSSSGSGSGTEKKAVIRLPLSKPHLAHALALEWDLLTSAQQATKPHLVPLTALVCRALDIADDDAAHQHQQPNSPAGRRQADAAESEFAPVRTAIAAMLMRYLDTDSLLCWAPPTPAHQQHAPPPPPPASSTPAGADSANDTSPPSLRALQQETALPILSFLSARVWPGVALQPDDDSASLVPRGQSTAARAVVRGWLLGLPHWELAAVERAALAAKSLLGAVRLVVEWSEGEVGAASSAADAAAAAAAAAGNDGVPAEAYSSLAREGGLVAQRDASAQADGDSVGGGAEAAASAAVASSRFGVEEAARAASLEVDWQTRRWGEVEDTHDVDKEDLRRQLGSVVLLVSGTGSRPSEAD